MAEVLQEDDLRSRLLELSVLDDEIGKRKKARGIDYFTPNAPQLRALRSDARVVAYVGGNRAGKSSCGAVWLISHLTGNYRGCQCHGEWFSRKKRYNGLLKAVIVATDFPVIERVIEPKLMAFLPKDWVAHNGIRRTPQGYLRRLIGKNGSTVDILSNEMDAMAFESADWDIAWIDEPTSNSRYISIQRGLTDRRGLTMLTFTPLIEPWMKEKLIDKADGRFIDVIQADTYENTQDIHGHPILSKESIAEFEATMPNDLRQTRIHGRFFHLRGIVYTEFSHGIHVRNWEYKYPDPVICVLDPHDRKPHHVIWAWVDRMDWLYVDRELLFHGNLTELKKQILLEEQKAGYRIARRIIDPNFGMKPAEVGGGMTVIQELGRKPFSVRFGPANDDKVSGRMKVKNFLYWNPKQQLSITNSPKLFFHSSQVPATIESIANYQYEEWRGPNKDDRDVKEKEKQKGTDGADTVRYLCMSEPQFDLLAVNVNKYELEEAPY